MKIRCLKSDLVKGVSIVSKAVPTKTTMPILECILIDATTDIIKLTANDMELGIETVIRGQIDEKGMIALDARIFSDIVRKLPDNEIVIESGVNFQTLITCEKAKFNISGKSGEDFSYLPYLHIFRRRSAVLFCLRDVFGIFCLHRTFHSFCQSFLSAFYRPLTVFSSQRKVYPQTAFFSLNKILSFL